MNQKHHLLKNFSSRCMHFHQTCPSIVCTHYILEVTLTLGQVLAKLFCPNHQWIVSWLQAEPPSTAPSFLSSTYLERKSKPLEFLLAHFCKEVTHLKFQHKAHTSFGKERDTWINWDQGSARWTPRWGQFKSLIINMYKMDTPNMHQKYVCLRLEHKYVMFLWYPLSSIMSGLWVLCVGVMPWKHGISPDKATGLGCNALLSGYY